MPKAITEATVVVQRKPQSRPQTKAPAKKEATHAHDMTAEEGNILMFQLLPRIAHGKLRANLTSSQCWRSEAGQLRGCCRGGQHMVGQPCVSAVQLQLQQGRPAAGRLIVLRVAEVWCIEADI